MLEFEISYYYKPSHVQTNEVHVYVVLPFFFKLCLGVRKSDSQYEEN